MFPTADYSSTIAVNNSELLFGELMTREVISSKFSSILKVNDKGYPPTIRPKVESYDGKWKVEVYDERNWKRFPSHLIGTYINLVPKYCNVATLLRISHISIGPKEWSVIVKMVQCIVRPPNSKVSKCQISLTDEERAVLKQDALETTLNNGTSARR